MILPLHSTWQKSYASSCTAGRRQCNCRHNLSSTGIIFLMNLNAPAPDFLLSDLDGQPHRLSDYRGQVVAVIFWSAECGWSEQADSELRKTSVPRWGTGAWND